MGARQSCCGWDNPPLRCLPSFPFLSFPVPVFLSLLLSPFFVCLLVSTWADDELGTPIPFWVGFPSLPFARGCGPARPSDEGLLGRGGGGGASPASSLLVPPDLVVERSVSKRGDDTVDETEETGKSPTGISVSSLFCPQGVVDRVDLHVGGGLGDPPPSATRGRVTARLRTLPRRRPLHSPPGARVEGGRAPTCMYLHLNQGI